MIKSVIWSSMLDYPGHICATIFFGECNFKCEFCHNKNMQAQQEYNFEKDILPKLLERQEMVDGVTLSGGECSVSENSQEILDMLYENNFKICLHTNGYNLDFIKKNINKIEYIAMDIKSTFEKYSKICGKEIDTEKIKETIGYIIYSGKPYEFRTTVYPKYIGETELLKIAQYLKDANAKSYVIQQYNKVNGDETKPYTKEQMHELREKCNSIITTKLRGA